MWLMQKEACDSYTDMPSAPGSQFSVTKHLHSMACLQIQWYPQTHVFPSLTLWPTIANSLKEVRPAALPCVWMGTPICLWLAFRSRQLILRFQAVEITSNRKGKTHWHTCALWRHSPEHHLSEKSKRQVVSQGDFGFLTCLAQKALVELHFNIVS